MNRYIKQLFIPFLGIILLHNSAQAQNNKTLPEVTVVGKPIVEAIKIDSFAAVSAIITKSQIKDLNAIDVASALRRTPGVQISRYNPVGAFGGDQGGAVFIRGMGVSRPGSEIKTYIDGLPFYMGLWNHPLLDLLPVNGMQSITVYKSPQTQINGNNFASVNLHSLSPVPDSIKLQGNARISFGSFNTITEQANLAGRTGKLDYGIAQGFAKSNGHRSNARGELKNIMANLGLDLNANWRTEIRFIYVNNKASDPGDKRITLPATAPEYNTEAGMLSASLLHHYKNISGELRLFANKGTGSWLDQPAPDGNTISHFNMSGIRWKEHFMPWKKGILEFGADYDHVGGSADFNRISPAPQTKYDAPGFNLLSPFATLSHKFSLNNQWSLRPSVGIRLYSHNKFNSSIAPHAGLSLESEKFVLFGNLSKGINYPGLETPLLSSLIAPLGNSWEHLKAEELNHIELGFKWIPAAVTQLDVSVFQDKVKNRYVFGFPPNVPPPPQFINLGSYRMQGLEISVRQTLAKQWHAFAGLTLLDPSIDNLPYTPKTAVTAGINGTIGRLGIVVDGQYQSSVWSLNRARAAGDVNTERVDGFTIINTRLSYKLPFLGHQGEIFTAIENLLNKTYAYRPGYPMPGRWFQLGVSVSFANNNK